MRIIFMGSPDFAVPSLEALIASSHTLLAVYAQPPRPAGRGQKERKTPVHLVAESAGIPVYTPVKLTEEEIDKIADMKPELIAVAAYGLILPQALLDVAPCINVHPSALPRWRGAAPIQHTILSGDKTTDMCIMEMEKGLDTGAVYKRVPYSVGENETTGELHDRMAHEGATHLLDVIDNWECYKNAKTPQTGETIYAHKITKDMAKIDWTKNADEIHNLIRGLSPFMGATFRHHHETLKVFQSEKVERSGKAGEVLEVSKEGLIIACAQGAVKLNTLQRAGKSRVHVSDLLNGYRIENGDILF